MSGHDGSRAHNALSREIHANVVAVEARDFATGNASYACGLALGGALVLTTARFPAGGCSFLIGLGAEPGSARLVPAELVATAKVQAAEHAFASLAASGWRFGNRDGRGYPPVSFVVHLLRLSDLSAAAGLPPGLPLDWDSELDKTWVGSEVRVLAAHFGEPPIHIQTRGVLCNASRPPGLLLVDARRGNSFAGAGIASQSPGSKRGASLVACLAPSLWNSSDETVVLSLAVPLLHIRDAVLDNVEVTSRLRPEELAMFSSALPVCLESGLNPKPPEPHVAVAAQRGVVLLWIEATGSWASAVVLSPQGHLLTCAHLLTGKSWMEIPAEDPNGQNSSPSSPLAPPRASRPVPSWCRGRGQARTLDGQFKEFEFEAEVLFVAKGFLDVAMLLVRRTTRRGRGSLPELVFAPLSWSGDQSPAEGTEVWAVGHGLFGPGASWAGPSITQGSVARVARGQGQSRPAVIQSTATVYRGSSGGALIEASTGVLLGMVTTNVKHHDGAVLPHVNFSLPVALLTPVREFLTDPSRRGALEALVDALTRSSANEEEQLIWRLEPEPLPLPSRMEERRQMALEKAEQLQQAAEKAASESDAASNGVPNAAPTVAVPGDGGQHPLRGVQSKL